MTRRKSETAGGTSPVRRSVKVPAAAKAARPARPAVAGAAGGKRPATGGKRTAGPAGAPARSRTGAARPAGPALRTIEELMAHAHAMEVEASERYAEFADAMTAHNNREVAELFRKLARIEFRHAEQILETMHWSAPPSAGAGGIRWEGTEGPETGDSAELHYLMTPYHALQIARHNEERARRYFARIARNAATATVRKAAGEMAAEEAAHVELIDQWLNKTPAPETDWARDPDPPYYAD